MKAKKTLPRGRPPLAPTEKKRRNFTFRGTDEMHQLIANAAAESGRSISEEIEWRLGQSFTVKITVEYAVEKALEKTFAYVDKQLAKDREEAERTRPLRRPFLDILSGNKTDGDEQ